MTIAEQVKDVAVSFEGETIGTMTVGSEWSAPFWIEEQTADLIAVLVEEGWKDGTVDGFDFVVIS